MNLQKQRLDVINLISKKVVSWSDRPAPKSDLALDTLVRFIYGMPSKPESDPPFGFLTNTNLETDGIKTQSEDADTPLKRILKRLAHLDIRLTKPTFGFNSYVVGIEGMNLDWTPNADRIDEYNDLICIVDVDYTGLVSLGRAYKGTTEAGKYYTDHPLNPQGAAHVKLDCFHKDIWVLGTHRNQPNCLVQIGGEITITRDLDRDGTRKGDSNEVSGYFGINFHSAFDDQGTIDRWSAGCCVVPKIKEKDAMVNHLKKATNKKISYILLDGSILM
jgi:hypothetical protein